MDPLLLAYSLSGVAGLRSSLAVLVVSIAVAAGYLHPNPSLAWVGSWWIVLLAFTGTIVEFLGDKVPVLDHALHAIHFALAPLAGAVAALSGYHGDPTLGVLLALLGGGNALFVHTARAGTRLASGALTLGLGNIVLSIVEDCLAVLFILVAILAPWLTALCLVLVTVWAIRKIRQLRAPSQGYSGV